MDLFFPVLALIFLYMSGWFVIGLLLKRNDVADIAWGLGFVLIAWATWYVGGRSSAAGIANVLVTVWGTRLAWHIYQRNSKRGEDFRYLEWRNTWKNFYLRSYFQIFILQGLLMFLIAFPIIALNGEFSPLVQTWAPVGVLIWLFGFYFESVGDAQLKAFISNPANKGKLMTSGLWKYTRHPNYFGEVTQWWGLFVLAAGATGNLLTIVGPLTITMLILYVSGVPLLEQKYEGNPEWEAYKSKTSVFVPWFPGR